MSVVGDYVLVGSPRPGACHDRNAPLENNTCRKTIRRLLFININTLMKTTKHSTTLLATWVTLRILIVLNWIYGAVIFGMLAMSFAAAGWTWRAFGVDPVLGHEGMVAGMRAIMVIGIAGTPLTYVVFSRLLRIVESVRSGVAFTTENAGRLRTIAWAMLGLELLRICVVAIASAVSTKDMPLRMNGNLHITAWLAILMLFVLAQVFLEGTRMREDLEGTV
jgi:Protein of unknown function (DUF2975)